VPGAADLVRACHGHGLRVVLASSADPREFAVLRAALDAEDAIDAATSAADVDQSKPARDLVRVALDRAGVRPGQAVFVGDTVWDVRACQAAGVACVGVRTGGISEQDLLDAGAVRVYRSPAEILADFPGSLLDRGRPSTGMRSSRGELTAIYRARRQPRTTRGGVTSRPAGRRGPRLWAIWPAGRATAPAAPGGSRPHR
jgi:hypothetical protein